MKKTIFEEMGGTYIRHGDYFILHRRRGVYSHFSKGGAKTFGNT